ncbi:MAG: WG repeat-containing protein [Chitinophagales bacterium]
MEAFKNGVALVNKDWLWGVIDMEGKEIIPTIYNSIFINEEKDNCTKGRND